MLDDITTSMNVSSNKLWETVKPALLQSMGCKESDKTEQLNKTSELMQYFSFSVSLSSLIVMLSSSIHVFAYGRIASLFMSE